tara:strand:- start:163 stop:1182 length:1020 start_codon:yes stop_codon:yes gene_type:complete
MNVSQRGTSFSYANGTYCLDRFFMGTINGSSAATVTQDSSSPDGFSNSLKVDVTTADTSLAVNHADQILYRVEARDLQQLAFGTSSAKNFTLSFYVKSNKTGTYSVNIGQNDNSYKQANLTYTINSANTWERKSLTFTGDTSGVINDDNGHGFEIVWVLAAGTNFTSGSNSASFVTYADANYSANHGVNVFDSTDNTWFLTGVQLEVGDNATDFEHRSFAEELKLCQRYFYSTQSDGGTSDYRFAISDGANGVYINAYINLPVSMRATPSGTTTVAGAFYYNSGSGDSSVTPSGGQNASAGRTHELVRIGWYNHSNNIGGTHDQKVGQWLCAATFEAEL